MNNISKVSDITASDVAEYIRLDDPTTDESNLLNNLLLVAKEYIKQFTGRTDEEIDQYADMIICVLILVQDMWDNRTMFIQGNVNPTVDTILHLHQVNLL